MSTTDPRPRITDDELDRLDLDAGLDDLLAGLLDTSEARALVTERAPGRRHRRTWPVLVAAAAAVVAMVAVPTYLHERSRDQVDLLIRPLTLAPRPAPGPSKWHGPSSYAVLDAPGWEADASSVVTLAGKGVYLAWFDGQREVQLQWLRAGVADSYTAQDQRLYGDPDHLTVLGRTARVWAGGDKILAYLPDVDGWALRVNGVFMSDADFRELVTHLHQVDADGLAAALPASVITPDEAPSAEKAMLRGTRSAPGHPVGSLVGFNDPAQGGALVAATIGCGWARSYAAADDLPGQLRAISVLRSARHWPLLTDVVHDRRYYDRLVAAMVAQRSGTSVEQAAGCSDDLLAR